MALQDDINNLTSQINEEQQSATILEADIAKEQQNSAQKVHSLQDRAQRHHDSIERMQQELQVKQRELAQEQQRQADEAKAANEKAKHVAKEIARHELL